MTKIYSHYRYFDGNIADFKKFINCFNLFECRSILSVFFKYDNFFFLDFGFRYLIKIKSLCSFNNFVLINKMRFTGLYNDIHFICALLKYSIVNHNKLFIFKKVLLHNCFIIGRFLNTLSNGFSIGVFGFVGFVSKRNLIYDKNMITSIFNIAKIDFFIKRIVLSQKSINKSVYRILFKLSSVILYISNN
jgi:hypothetical protein